MKRAGVIPFGKVGMHTIGRVEGKPRVTIVREPATWLRSFFLNLHGPMGVDIVNTFLALRTGRDQTFEEFGWRYVNEMPGQISRMYLHYESEIELRTEHLASDTAAMLSRLNVPCDFKAVFDVAPEGVTGTKITMTDEVRAAINAADFYLGDRTQPQPEVAGSPLERSVQ
jgi:hypothetical protein